MTLICELRMLCPTGKMAETSRSKGDRLSEVKESLDVMSLDNQFGDGSPVSRRASSRLWRSDTIMQVDYKYRSDRCAYPAVKPKFVNVPHVIVMVGLPARGKTYISKKLCRYLNWCGFSSNVFNVGEYRRKEVGKNRMHDFFRPDNEEAQCIRKKCAVQALKDVAEWLSQPNNNVAIFDATNTTVSRRKLILDFCIENNYKLFFVESICDDPKVVSANIKEVKIYSPDYTDVLDKDKAMDDFKTRIKHYESEYVPLGDDDDGLESCLSFIKIINAGSQYFVNNIDGYLQSQVVYYLMNTHILRRSIYLTTHGECIHNLNLEVGGDSTLSETGKQFAEALRNFMKSEDIKDLKVWTSSLTGAKETANYIPVPSEAWRALDFLDCGECHGTIFEDLAKKFPGVFTANKGPLDFAWRYPGGESYKDMLSRLEPVLLELERQQNVLVISHRTTMRCLLAYFLDHNPDEVSRINVPLHTVYKLTPIAYGCRVEKWTLSKDGVLTREGGRS